MSEVLQANIFFIIASIGVVAFVILLSVLLYHLIKIARSVERIVDRVEAGSEVIAEDISQLRENLNPARLVSFVMGLVSGKKTTRRRATKRKE